MSQLDKVYGHLTRGPITPLQALSRYGIYRLAPRIMELRDRGHRIHTTIIKKHGKRFARYSLAS